MFVIRLQLFAIADSKDFLNDMLDCCTQIITSSQARDNPCRNFTAETSGFC